MLGKLFSVRDGLKLPALWRWLLTLAGCLLTGLGLALACRLIDSQSLRQTLAALTQGSLWFTALFLALTIRLYRQYHSVNLDVILMLAWEGKAED